MHNVDDNLDIEQRKQTTKKEKNELLFVNPKIEIVL